MGLPDEYILQLLCPIKKDIANIAPDEDKVDQPSPEDGITNKIAHFNAVAASLENMFVNPTAIRAAALFIHKSAGWFPCGDFRLPANGYAMKV
jgi:hypothetical protein